MQPNQTEKMPEVIWANFEFEDSLGNHERHLQTVQYTVGTKYILATKHEECLRVLEVVVKEVELQPHHSRCALNKPYPFSDKAREEFNKLKCDCWKSKAITTAEQYLKGVGR